MYVSVHNLSGDDPVENKYTEIDLEMCFFERFSLFFSKLALMGGTCRGH